MSDWLHNLQSAFRITDLVDMGLVAFISYRVLLLIRGTRAMQMLTGLGILGIGFFLSSTLELFTTHWLLSYFFDYLILVVIVLFQDDLRRALTSVGRNPFFLSSSEEEEREMVDEISRAAIQLARERIGALLVIERETGLKNFIDTGSRLDSKVKAEILYSIFVPNSPIHDGAVIINNGRIAAAGCFLPLSKDPNLDKNFGTRHRAAIGISEDTDAVVILVSEEAGAVHLVRSSRIHKNLNEQELVETLSALLDLGGGRDNLGRRLRNWLQGTQKKRPGSSTRRGWG